MQILGSQSDPADVAESRGKNMNRCNVTKTTVKRGHGPAVVSNHSIAASYARVLPDFDACAAYTALASHQQRITFHEDFSKTVKRPPVGQGLCSI